MKQPLRVGLTGGIGSGKSTVAKIFEVLNIPVFYADAAAKEVMNSDAVLRQQLLDAFGENTYIDNVLNRAHLASIVFNNTEQLEKLNAFVHPATIAAADKWFAQQTTPYVIKEAALLFESGSVAGLDYIIGVSAPQHVRIQRTMHRDGISREQVLQRIDKQVDESIKMKLCDFVVVNDEQQMLLPQVLELHRKLLSLTTKAQSHE
jgi:dephospho-CoA kinase